MAEFDIIFKDHLEGNANFEETSKIIQNELLDFILAVCQDKIKSEFGANRFYSGLS